MDERNEEVRPAGRRPEIPPGFRLRCVLGGHDERVCRMAWSPDGAWLASTSEDGAVVVWDAESGRPRRTLAGSLTPAYSVAWSPDGEALACGSRSVKVWGARRGELLHALKEATGLIYAVAWSPDGGTLVTGGGDATIRFWDADTWRLRRALAAQRTVNRLAWAPAAGNVLAAACDDGAVRFFDETGEPTAKRETREGWILALAWSSDDRLLAVGTKARTIQVWPANEPGEGSKPAQPRTLEGHIGEVTALSFSSDNRLLASESLDGAVRLWRTDTWEVVASLERPPFSGSFSDLAFRPNAPVLATIDHEADAVTLWDLDVELFFSVAPHTRTVHYTSAKVVLVGESNIGKSCLAQRLVENRYEPQGTTHGMRFWTMAPEQLDPRAAAPPGEKRDVVLWDMGGQDEYRLVHQLFLHDTTVALVLFDPTRGRSAFEEVEAWNKRLEKQMGGRAAGKLLVGTKLDGEGAAVDLAAVHRLVQKCGFAGYYPTSAKAPRGIPELRAAIASALDWDAAPTTSRTELLQRIRDEIDRRRKSGQVVLYFAELEEATREGTSPDSNAEAVGSVVGQLALQGVLVDTRLAGGERALVLQIDVVEQYAGSIILMARDDPRGVPAIEESSLASPKLVPRGVRPADRPPRVQEMVVLQCVVQLLLEHGICVRHEGLLVFPSLFRSWPDSPAGETPPSAALYYDFSGAIDNIYASLVAWLAISKGFGHMRLWDDRAEFGTVDRGECGVRKVQRGGGFARLDVYFTDGTPDAARDLFMGFIDEHLRKNGVEIVEHIALSCDNPDCGRPFEEDDVRARIVKGHDDIGCIRCDARTSIRVGARDQRRDPSIDAQLWALVGTAKKERVRMVEDVPRSFADPGPRDNAARPVRVLHLSDLHFRPDADPVSALQPLLADLADGQEGLGVDHIDFLVLSGDLGNRASPAEFERALEFTSALRDRFMRSAQRCVIVPGNHDVNWDENVYTWVKERQAAVDRRPQGTYVRQGDGYLVRDDRAYPHRFKNFSDKFYHYFLQEPYPTAFEDQCLGFLFPDMGLQFLTLNTAWEIDEYFEDRSRVHPGALARGLERADEQVRQARAEGKLRDGSRVLRIAVGHHPVTGNEKIADDAFLDGLKRADVRFYLHGHVHEDRADVRGYLERRKLYAIGAGSFGAPIHDRPESTPRLYNLFEIAPDLHKVRVHTRCLRRDGGAWEGWANWPGESPHQKLTYYEVKLDP